MTIEPRWKLVGAAVAVAAIVIPLSIYRLQPEPLPATDQALDTVHEQPAATRFGPGLLTDVKPLPLPPPAVEAAADPWVPSGLAATPDKHLVMNKQMRAPFDYFLQPANPGDRSERLEKLQAYMKVVLPAAAYEEATPIASNYVKYLGALDMQDADERRRQQPTGDPSTSSGIEQLKARMAQNTRLRQDILGTEVAHLWFADEEAGMQVFLDRRGHTPRIVISEGTK